MIEVGLNSNGVMTYRMTGFFAEVFDNLQVILGQVSRMTGILEVERSLDSCTLAVHRPLAYFRSANVKTFCKYTKFIIKDVNYCKNFLQITKDGCNNNNDDYDKIRIKRVLLLSKKYLQHLRCSGGFHVRQR